VVTIRGVDVFDPSTGAVRSGGVDDIACWFIDTDYDGQSFFVRHAYFLYGGKDTKDGPYEKLKKALRAEIDEGEWSKLYSATSQPFDPPTSGKIAVKVIISWNSSPPTRSGRWFCSQMISSQAAKHVLPFYPHRSAAQAASAVARTRSSCSCSRQASKLSL